MYDWTRPRIGIPVHGEAAHLVAHGSLMTQSGIPEVAQVRNGDMIRLAPGAAEIIDQVPFGRIYKDGRLVGDDEADGHPRPAAAFLRRPCRGQRRAR